MAIVLAFAGKSGSGKTTVTKALAESLGCWRASFGDYVRHVVGNRGLPQTRENLQVVGTELLEKDTHGFCCAVLLNCGWRPGEMLIIDGLRHMETIDPIKQLVSPAKLKVVFLAVDDETRLERLVRRGDRDKAALTETDFHSSERQVNSTLAEKADLVIQGSEPVQESIRRILEWMRSQ